MSRHVALALDLVRLFVGATLLAFASWTDWRWRRAPNALWLAMGLVGAALLAAQAALDWAAFRDAWPYLVFVPAFAGVIYALWYFGLIAGGADAKALMALGLLVPFPIALADGAPPLASPLPGAFAVLGNSLLAFLLVPLALVVWNAAHGDLRFPHLVLGVRRAGRDVRRGHAWPMETLDAEGRRTTRLFGSRMAASEVDEQFERIQALGDQKVWVSPKVPFMIPLLVGFIAAFTLGDLMTAGIRAALP